MEFIKMYLSSNFGEAAMKKALDWVVSTLPSIALILVLCIVATLVFRLSLRRLKTFLIKTSEDKDPHDEMERHINTVVGMARKAGSVTIMLIAVIMLLRELGVEIAPIIASAGIVGLAIGFGAQNLVRDIISGVFILIENQVRVGDVAVVNGTGGVVEALNIRTIVLRDVEGAVHVFPHGAVTTLSNKSKEWSAAVMDVGVAYREDTDEVSRVIGEVFEDLRKDGQFADKILEPIEIMGVDSFGDSAVNIKVRIKTPPLKQWDVGREFRRRLKKAFDRKGIEIPFPHRTICWSDAGGPVKVRAEGAEHGKS